MWTEYTIASNCAAMATAKGNALLATAEKSVGNSIERIMIKKNRSNMSNRSYRSLFCPDAHAMKRAPNEKDGNQKEDGCQYQSKRPALLFRQAYRQFHGQQAEERRELDHRIHCHRRSVLKRIADRVAHDCRIMQRRALL